MKNLTYHSRFASQVDQWTPLRSHYRGVFDEVETDALVRAANHYDNRHRRVVILAFENRYAALGGLSPVIRYLPRYLAKSGEDVIFITPFHKNNASIQRACDQGIIQTAFSGLQCNVGTFEESITGYTSTDGAITTWYIDMHGFFCADQDPYCYPDKNELIKDALGFCCAVPSVLKKIGREKSVLVHANDWETAAAAFTCKLAILNGVLKSAKAVLTLHNSYDAYVSPEMHASFFGRKSPGLTALQISLPLLDAPLTTVSETFAHELTHDPLQKEVFADHLQSLFAMNPPVGIRNGLFDAVKKDFGAQTDQKTGRAGKKAFLEKKSILRKKLIERLKNTDDERITGRLVFKKNKDTAPIFLLSGRLDMMQKGYDVIFHAFRRLERGVAKLIFTPSNPIIKNSESFNFFVDHARKSDGDIIILPYIIPEDAYREMLGGSSFLVMPSIYEPFGAATEGYLNGTPVIGRGTGGLWIQIESIRACRIPGYFQNFFGHDEGISPQPTGILFHEDIPKAPAKSEWRAILSAAPAQRAGSPLYSAMIEAAHSALKDAIKIFHNKEQYGMLIENSFSMLSEFSWEDSIEKYKRVYDCVLRRAL